MKFLLNRYSILCQIPLRTSSEGLDCAAAILKFKKKIHKLLQMQFKNDFAEITIFNFFYFLRHKCLRIHPIKSISARKANEIVFF
jgi:hypothetical protein